MIGKNCQHSSRCVMAMNVKTRNVSLSPEIDAFVSGRIASGRFSSASEVVRAALRLLEDEERRREASLAGESAAGQRAAR